MVVLVVWLDFRGDCTFGMAVLSGWLCFWGGCTFGVTVLLGWLYFGDGCTLGMAVVAGEKQHFVNIVSGRKALTQNLGPRIGRQDTTFC